jgi:RNA polymerase sigma-70 factor (ECF subfamily)
VGFPTTSWSLVLAARQGPAEFSRPALEQLCELYWYPVYAYIRSRGNSPDEAGDLTQEFFFRLLDKDYLDAIEAPRGRFRWFLQGAIKNFLANEYDARHAQKRGGGRVIQSLDAVRAEQTYRLEPADPATPEKIFDRRWSLLLLNRVMARLGEEHAKSGKNEHFARLKQYLVGDDDVSYRDLALAIGLTEGAVKVAVHRLRRRFAEMLRAEIAETVADASEVDGELMFLMGALR